MMELLQFYECLKATHNSSSCNDDLRATYLRKVSFNVNANEEVLSVARLEAIADPGLREDVLRGRQIGLNLLS